MSELFDPAKARISLEEVERETAQLSEKAASRGMRAYQSMHVQPPPERDPVEIGPNVPGPHGGQGSLPSSAALASHAPAGTVETESATLRAQKAHEAALSSLAKAESHINDEQSARAGLMESLDHKEEVLLRLAKLQVNQEGMEKQLAAATDAAERARLEASLLQVTDIMMKLKQESEADRSSAALALNEEQTRYAGVLTTADMQAMRPLMAAAGIAQQRADEERQSLIGALVNTERQMAYNTELSLQAQQSAHKAAEMAAREVEILDNERRRFEDDLAAEQMRRKNAEKEAARLQDALRHALSSSTQSKEEALAAVNKSAEDRAMLSAAADTLGELRGRVAQGALVSTLDHSGVNPSAMHVAAELATFAGSVERKRLQDKLLDTENDVLVAKQHVADSQKESSAIRAQMMEAKKQLLEKEKEVSKRIMQVRVLQEELSMAQLATKSAQDECEVKTSSMAAELEACRKMISSQEQLLGDSAPLAARETARANSEAHRANALQSQLRQVTEQHAHERTLASGLQDKVNAIEAQLRDTLASHEQELMTLGDKHATSEKQLRSRLATALGSHSYMEKALERARVQADTALDTFEKRLEEERTKFKAQLSAAQLARAEAEARMKEATRESGSIKLTLTSQEALQTTARNAALDAERAEERMREMHEKMLEAEKLAKNAQEEAAAKIAAIRAGSASEGHAMTQQVAERERQVREEREKRRIVEDELSALRNQMRYVEKADAERALRLQAKLENAEHEAEVKSQYKGKFDDLQQRYRRLEDDLAATKADLSDVKASKARLEAGWSPEELPGQCRAAVPYQAGLEAGVTTQMSPETRQARAELTRIDGERRRLEHANMELERRVAGLQQSCIELQEGKTRVEMDHKRLQREKEDGVARAYASVDDMRREMETKLRDSELAAIAQGNTLKLETSEAAEASEEHCRQLEGSLAAAKQQLDSARAQNKQCAAHEVIRVISELGELRCPICTEFYADPHSLQTCFHTFCKACVVPALIEYDSPKCPLCQMTARRTDLVANAAMKAVVTRAASISQSYSSQTESTIFA